MRPLIRLLPGQAPIVLVVTDLAWPHGLDLGGGAARLRPIDGAGSKGAPMAYIPSDRFLYAGDYIQPGGPGSFSAVSARQSARPCSEPD